MTDTPAATYQRTDTIPLDELTPYPGNAKRGNTDVILESLRRNSQYRSLVVREIENGPLIVLAGNHTMKALAAHGAGDCGETVTNPRGETRPCGVCDNDPAWALAARCEIVACDDATARRINLADNRTSELGTYDNEALAELLTYTREDDDLGGTGYTEEQVEDLLATAAAPAWSEGQAEELATNPFDGTTTDHTDNTRDDDDTAPAAPRTLARDLPIDAIFSMGRLCSITLNVTATGSPA